MMLKNTPTESHGQGIESASIAFLYLLGAHLQTKKAIDVPKEVSVLGGLSLNNLAIAASRHGTPVGTASNTHRYTPPWLSGVEILSHFDPSHRLAQVAVRTTHPESTSALIVDKFSSGGAFFSRMIVDQETVLPPQPLRNVSDPTMLSRREQITRATKDYLDKHVGSDTFKI